jgi:enoyl-CoA hydratase
MNQQAEGMVTGRRDGPVGWVVFDNPARLNALTSDMAGQALAIVESYAVDSRIRVIILRGAGDRAFMSGGDISKFEKTRFDPATATSAKQNSSALRAALLASEKPVIAMIHGYCLGGGLGLALCADLRFGAATAKLGIPAALRGIAYAPEGLQRLIDLVGPSMAKDMMFSGRRVPAEEAYRSGLLDRLFEAETLEDETHAYAELVAANAPLSIRASKVCIEQLALPETQRDTARMQAVQDAAANSADFREATMAFMEKRRPVFRGV